MYIGPYIPYSVSVSAINEFGEGKAAMGINFTKEGGWCTFCSLSVYVLCFVLCTYIAPLTVPHNVTIVHSNKTLIVTWTPLTLTEARGFVAGYKIAYISSSTECNNSDSYHTTFSDKNFKNITIVDDTKQYGVKVAGFTEGGIGPYSSVVYESGNSKKCCS